MENKTHAGNYAGTTNMNAENQDMAFVNDTLEFAPDTQSINIQKDKHKEDIQAKIDRKQAEALVSAAAGDRTVTPDSE